MPTPPVPPGPPSDSGPEPGATPSGAVSRRYLAPMLAIIAAAVALLEFEYAMNPIPPGVDPAHWVAVSYAYVGLPYPPAAAVGSPWVDPPLLFPLLGGLVRLFGSPLTADFVLGAILLSLFGLSVIHIARRYLSTGPAQVAFVAAAVFNGTILSMLFWGGYPNFLGFVVMNEALVFLLLYVVRGGYAESLLFYGAFALVYLTHTLTFSVLLGSVAMAAILLLASGKLTPRFLVRGPNLVGVALLVGVVGGYLEIIRRLKIVPPGYVSSNPAAFLLDGIGQVFNPLTVGYVGPADNLPNWLAEVSLLLLAGMVCSLVVIARRSRLALALGSSPPSEGDAAAPAPSRLVNSPLVIAAAWTAGACIVPALGAIAHVDTDFPRFGYFLPLPLTLLATVSIER
ncbi:MAG: hypothetical protein L3K09_07700, partial [Thermoplasmata archaeon]|nr:hypothetical protein [Thermoplasmata archaeon]